MVEPPEQLTAEVPAEPLALLLSQAGLGSARRVVRLPGGGNNRVYRVEVDDRSALLKAYFRHPADPRDRLGTEFAFSHFAWENGVRRLPQPYAARRELGLGLYEFVAGRRLAPAEVDGDAVDQALTFYQELNAHRDRPETGQFPAASEACFSLADHLDCVERRIKRLERWEPVTDLDRQTAEFVRTELGPFWAYLRTRIEDRTRSKGIRREAPLPGAARRLSPSDFGFHNALREPSGLLRFLDFEYAGWDDPAKLACDFFCQPAVPVPAGFWDPCLDRLTADLPDPDRHRARMELLLPVYRVKWVAIRLNDFLAIDGARRRFARPVLDSEGRREQQFAGARRALEQVICDVKGD
jgi:hypothetical protein